MYTHNTVELNRLSGKTTPKTNLTLSPEFDSHTGELAGDRLVFSWGKPKDIYLQLIPHYQQLISTGPTSATTVLFVNSVLSQSLPRPSWHMREHLALLELQVQGCTRLKSQLLDNLFATFYLHFMRTLYLTYLITLRTVHHGLYTSNLLPTPMLYSSFFSFFTTTTPSFSVLQVTKGGMKVWEPGFSLAGAITGTMTSRRQTKAN